MSAMDLTIRSEEDAWKFLKAALGGDLESDQFDIKFDNWPILDIKFKGEQFQSSLTTKVMEGFIALQSDINRAYAKLKYDKPNGNLLSADERKSLEIVVKISPGSSETKVNFQELLEIFVKGAVNKMEPKHIVTVVLAAGLMWTGNSCWNSYLDHQVEMKQLEIQTFADAQETERMEIMKDAIEARPALQVVSDDSVELYNKILKGAVAADSVRIGNKEISQEEVKAIVKSTRTKSDEVRLDGACKILSVDSSALAGFSVKVKHLATSKVFKAELNEKFLSRKEKFKSLIQQAEWGKKPVILTMNCRELRGEIKDAIIIGVEPFEE